MPGPARPPSRSSGKGSRGPAAEHRSAALYGTGSSAAEISDKGNTRAVGSVLYPLAGLAADLQSSISSVTRALRELEAARLIERRSNGFSKPNQIFLGVPQTVQKCAIGMVKNEQPDCSKVSNPIAQNCTPNQINKNDLRWNKIKRTKEAYGRYQNVFLENYSELKIEIAELDALVKELSAYMQSTGRKYSSPSSAT